jgi:hypothetical protein
MSLELYRQSLTSAVEAAKVGFTAYPLIIEYDNRLLVDYSTQSNPYLCVEIMFVDGEQADLSPAPIHRINGFLNVVAVGKEGSGTAKLYTLLDHFYPQLQHKTFGDVRTKMATMTKPKLVTGWWGVACMVPFWVDKFP